VEPLDKVSSLRWEDITGRYMAVEMKKAIGSNLVGSVEVSVSLTCFFYCGKNRFKIMSHRNDTNLYNEGPTFNKH
jgi:hypothetical protein